MNEPLSHGKYTFYQSSFQELGGGKSASILSVAYDPGRTLKYLGSLMICLGIGVMFYVKLPALANIPARRTKRGRVADGDWPADDNDTSPIAASEPARK
jgi:hypothetical protein